MEFGLVIRFIEYFQIVTTSNYGAIANSHTLEFTTAHTKSSQSVTIEQRHRNGVFCAVSAEML
jgi:hypothetical protein